MPVVARFRPLLSLPRVCLLAVSLACAGVASAAQEAPASQAVAAAPATEAAKRLHALFAADQAWSEREYGYRKIDGRWRPGDRIASASPEAWERRQAHWRQTLAALDAIPVDALSREDQVNLAIFRTTMEADLNNARWKTWEAPFNSDTFFWSGMNPGQPYRTEEEWRNFIGRLGDIPRYFDENIANMERGLVRGWNVPRSTLDGRDRTIEPYTLETDANPFLATLAQVPASIPEPRRSALQAEGRKVVLEQVVPAYRALLAYYRDQYLPRTRTSVAASALPDGEAFYRTQIREYVTLDMDAQEIHALGLAEVERITADMHEVMARAGFDGTLEAFFAYLRSDPQFYAKTPRELIANAAYVAKKVDGPINHMFGTLPRFRFTMRPVPDDIAPNYTSGRGGLEACIFNTYDLPSRPLYNLPALVLHECSPGHSFQAALALEAPERPEFRQSTYFSGYGEGWALYTEWLGLEMGIYETPYEEFGRLTFEMWRAARLVIDTGLHANGWTREQAIDYLASHAALAQADVINEVDRYISWPGQALSYYIGYRTIRELRAEAEAELGEAFDVKVFHDTILGLGPVPLTVLQEEVRAYIARDKASGNATAR